ncbi:MAG: histidine phosphatase family protein [Actinomycetota bacterium]|nr:histidine phosphatase family protein [Actinomycetota bacterium]MDK1016798.1 histidine phosphatase family protein [Actinomycetota bacterium]MDK1026513.1 histidine phosphatase family protein [Actinomycetota bacterium]MDK1037989.1 histidine phosphatase family protein [Actinomycetota bacterium]MDK1096073.1 histidine phosphatase family protein [Actinomycetota bacterium]
MSVACRVFLVRHGEVANPNHVVYGDLPGFHLSPAGVLQAHGAADHLARLPIDAVVTSPLARAFETASVIALRHRIDPVPDSRLTESDQFDHWTGNRWDSIAVLFGDEFETYLADASAIDGGAALRRVSSRIIATIEEQIAVGRRGIVVVSHQDPIAATRLALTGGHFRSLRIQPPSHGEVICLTRDDDGRWTETSRWSPPHPQR